MDGDANRSLDRRLENLRDSLLSATDGMSDEQMSWHPKDKWCAAEVLEHLYLTYAGTIKGFEKMLQEGKPMATPSSMKHRVRRLVVLGFNHLPEGRKPPPTATPKGLPIEKVRSEFAIKIAAMDRVISQCEDRFGRDAKLLDHPILSPLTGAEWKKFHVIHGRHHEEQLLRLKQAQAVQA